MDYGYDTEKYRPSVVFTRLAARAPEWVIGSRFGNNHCRYGSRCYNERCGYAHPSDWQHIQSHSQTSRGFWGGKRKKSTKNKRNKSKLRKYRTYRRKIH